MFFCLNIFKPGFRWEWLCRFRTCQCRDLRVSDIVVEQTRNVPVSRVMEERIIPEKRVSESVVEQIQKVPVPRFTDDNV